MLLLKNSVGEKVDVL